MKAVGPKRLRHISGRQLRCKNSIFKMEYCFNDAHDVPPRGFNFFNNFGRAVNIQVADHDLCSRVL